MGFWKANRPVADVGRATRVVSAKLADGGEARCRLVLVFAEPQTQRAVDIVSDWHAQFTASVLGDLTSEGLGGIEQGLIAELRRCVPPRFPAVRSINVLSLHVLGAGSSATSGTLPSISPPPASSPPTSHVSGSRMTAVGWAATHAPPREALIPPLPLPAPRVDPVVRPPLRAASERPSSAPQPASATRAHSTLPAPVTAELAASSELGRALAPAVRDAASRLALAALRAQHALARGATVDGAAASLASLFPAQGDTWRADEGTRSAELEANRASLGAERVQAVEREAAVACTFLAHRALAKAGVTGKLAVVAVEAICRVAFPGVGVAGQLGRYFYAAEATAAAELARGMAALLRRDHDPTVLRELLERPLSTLEAILTLTTAGATR